MINDIFDAGESVRHNRVTIIEEQVRSVHVRETSLGENFLNRRSSCFAIRLARCSKASCVGEAPLVSIW